MTSSWSRIVCVVAAVALPAVAQVGAVVGPAVAPLGCPITIALSNDTASSVQTLPNCAFSVYDAMNVLIYPPLPCNQTQSPLAPGATLVTSWPQTDAAGAQVAPGIYVISVVLPPLPGGGVATFPVQVGGADAAIALRGVPKIGTTRGLTLCAPFDGGSAFVMAASLAAAPGMSSCAGVVPLVPDAVFFFSLDPANGLLQNFAGVLAPPGTTSNPVITFPPLPGTVGLTFVVAFVAYDLSLPCVITRISTPLSITVQ